MHSSMMRTVRPLFHHTERGRGLRDRDPLRQRPPPDSDPPQWTETALDRDPPDRESLLDRDRPLDRDPPL